MLSQPFSAGVGVRLIAVAAFIGAVVLFLLLVFAVGEKYAVKIPIPALGITYSSANPTADHPVSV
jgi:hypothetical protein